VLGVRSLSVPTSPVGGVGIGIGIDAGVHGWMPVVLIALSTSVGPTGPVVGISVGIAVESGCGVCDIRSKPSISILEIDSLLGGCNVLLPLCNVSPCFNFEYVGFTMTF